MDSRHVRHGTCEPNRRSLAHFPSLVRGMLASLAAGGVLVVPAFAQDDEPCPGNNPAPVPTAVAVTVVPIVVPSTTHDYFVLYVSHEMDADTTVELPVLVKRGTAGTTTLAENIEALPAERYRVEKYLIAEPADVDGDCTDDITELDDTAGNPVNPATAIELSDGAVTVPDQETLETLSYEYRGKMLIKFVLIDMDHGPPAIYFVNLNTPIAHFDFMDAVGLDRNQDELVFGTIRYDPDVSPGSYYFWLGPSNTYYSVARMEYFYTLLAASMPLLEDNLAVYMANSQLRLLQSNLLLYSESRIPLVFNKDIFPEISFLALNPGEGYGLLRLMELEDRPNPRDIVIYEALPNELPRVAGVISTVPQTPLTHVNLRAVQDRIPNAFIRDGLNKVRIASLRGKYVHYTVTETGWILRGATRAEVDAHYASSRPTQPQTPERDLSFTAITPLSQIDFDDWDAFGVKVANVAVLGTLAFPEGTVPDGFAIPFYFYDEFMKHNDFYTRIETMLADPDFQTDYAVQDDMLDDLRDDIKDAETPQRIMEALTTMNASFAEGVNRRYRSSTNNEDLPGFNGAGLYDSKSQKPSEDEDDLAKSLKEVYASLWNYRAYIERDFHRVDHLKTAMGILVHPSYQDELANGVAVSMNPPTGETDDYYVNTQLGEDLVTNPEAHSVPEEILLRQNRYTVLATSNLVEPGRLLMSDAQLTQLREHLTTIHHHFKRLYNPAAGKPFAMEIEFKITADDVLAIKQARPWVFGDVEPDVPPPPDPPAVSVSKNRSEVTEGRDAEFTLRRTVSSRALTVEVRVSENGAMVAAANEGTQTVAFTAGAATVPLVVATEDDSVAEANSVVRVQVEAGTGYTVASTDDSASVTVTDNDAPPPLDPLPPDLTPPPLGSGGGSTGSRDVHSNSPASATVITPTSTTTGTIAPAGDVDYFTVTVPQAGVLIVETSGSTATVGTVWQDGAELAMADSGGAGQNLRLSVRVAAGPVVVAVAGHGRQTGAYTLQTTLVVGYLENPGPDSFQSGIGVLSGWVCEAEAVTIAINGAPHVAAYGTERVDTQGVCGDTDNGFGLLFNWNLLGDGEHDVVAAVDGVELGRATITVTTLGAEFVRGAAGECEVADFPSSGEAVTLVWQQANQKFAIAGERAPTGDNAVRSGTLVGYLENPGVDSFQSGIGVISGWVCEADRVEIEVETENGEVVRQGAGYGTERLDTQAACGDTNNGFGLLFNWNLLDDGVHTVVAVVDDVELGRATVRVTTLGEEFVRGAVGKCVVEDFPMLGETVTLEWQQNSQNFVITNVE